MFSKLVALHAGTPIVVSQTSLTIVLVALGVVLIGVGFGLAARNKESLLQHRWTMTSALVLALMTVIGVMLPTTYVFYTDPDLMFFSSISIVTLIHGIIAVPTIVLSLLYAMGDVPQKTKRWMRITAILWVVTVLLGVVEFLVMQDLLVFPGM